MKQEGLKFHCKDCDVTFTLRSNFLRHVTNFHANKKVEADIVLDETNSISTQDKSIKSKPKELNKNQKIFSKSFDVLPKPKKGKWIVKLDRLNKSDLN